MATKYHIGDMFRVPRKKLIAVIVEAENDGGNNRDQYSLEYLDLETHEATTSHYGYHNSWWENHEIEKTFKPIRVFGM